MKAKPLHATVTKEPLLELQIKRTTTPRSSTDVSFKHRTTLKSTFHQITWVATEHHTLQTRAFLEFDDPSMNRKILKRTLGCRRAAEHSYVNNNSTISVMYNNTNRYETRELTLAVHREWVDQESLRMQPPAFIYSHHRDKPDPDGKLSTDCNRTRNSAGCSHKAKQKKDACATSMQSHTNIITP